MIRLVHAHCVRRAIFTHKVGQTELVFGARNFEKAQHIEKKITDVSSTIKALQNGTKLGAIAGRGFDTTLGENW